MLVAWALYVLKPVDENLSLLTAWFRLIYTVIALVALLNLVTVLGFVNASDTFTGTQPDQFYVQIMLSLTAFKSHWNFGLLFFGIHLGPGLFSVQVELYSEDTGDIVGHHWAGLLAQYVETISLSNPQFGFCPVYVLWGIDIHVMAAH